MGHGGRSWTPSSGQNYTEYDVNASTWRTLRRLREHLGGLDADALLRFVQLRDEDLKKAYVFLKGL